MIRLMILGLAMTVAATGAATGAANAELVRKRSSYDVKTTVDRLEAVLKKRGMTVFARIDHAAGARKVGSELRPTVLLIFGNPKIGTVLMQAKQTMGIDLPLKALAWRDAEGAVWLAYEKPADLARARGLDPNHKVIGRMTGALDKFTDAALAK